MATNPREKQALLAELAALVERLTPGDGIHPTAIEHVSLLRAARPAEPLRVLYKPALCVIAQGSKQVILGDEVYPYDASHHLIVSVDLPVIGQVTRATPRAPYLCFQLDLDPVEIADLVLKAGPPPPPSQRGLARGLFLGETSPVLLDAVLRLVRLLETPEDIPALAPLATREILYRLLKGEHGWRLAQIASANSQAQRIARAIGWLKTHFAEPLRIEDVAREVHMSTSSLHHHFKAVTAMSPLQYQKQLRLQEARRLLLSDDVDVATAGFRVGYESPSQFNREYRRLFGTPPGQDLRRLRGQPATQLAS
ncbi:AraC family transcriptional regulator [Pyxidicoccus fallax]|uniref:AraC family transcriptional regulator n=1 Tax=Pyxidicoccus fallax TaxID=394095 RepID=A0A848LW33_9BACT|nr:AraC family transcriptional regulator [Pyxidicoccus fallax]NMO22287.1 AraC family transcriptional regulator [Pyxidicoccus fallax]NPC83909.1 AraC family transcriptional regulator [Pyxidicoccus fallax]